MPAAESLNAPHIACPVCDAFYPDPGSEKLICGRCHAVLSMPERRAGLWLVLLAATSAALIFGAVTLPFLTIEKFWISSEATLIGTALAFEGPLLILSLAVLALILLLPALRLGLTSYVLLPVVLGKRALPGAATAFRWSETLRPWSMAEIFVIGCGVALAKIAAMAEVTFGPAFYMFAVAVVLIWIQDRMICRHSVWLTLER
jgi:paraquat-inducible protein A